MFPAVFHPRVYATDVLPPTIWSEGVVLPEPNRLGRTIRTEVAIIGGGYAGLSAALHLVRDHGIEATVLDAAPVGWGASARNAGFVTLPAAAMSAEEVIARWGEAEAYAFFRSQAAGIELVRRLIVEERIEADIQGDATFEVAHSEAAVGGLQRTADIYRHRFGLDAAFLGRWAFNEIGHGVTEQFGALRLRGGFGLNPLKFLLGLEAAARRHGAVVHADSPVIAWDREEGRHVLETPDGRVSARFVILATNGYTPDELKPELANRTIPALSNIVVTRPLSELELAREGWRTPCPVANARALLFYYRLLPDRRFLFGARGGTHGSDREDRSMRLWLEKRLGDVFPSWRGIETTHFWNGLVCLTARRTPAIGRLKADPSVLFGFGWHGNGVNTAPWAGQVLAQAIATRSTGPVDVPAPYRGLPLSLFAPAIRRLALKAAYLWYGLTDRS